VVDSLWWLVATAGATLLYAAIPLLVKASPLLADWIRSYHVWEFSGQGSISYLGPFRPLGPEIAYWHRNCSHFRTRRRESYTLVIRIKDVEPALAQNAAITEAARGRERITLISLIQMRQLD